MNKRMGTTMAVGITAQRPGRRLLPPRSALGTATHATSGDHGLPAFSSIQRGHRPRPHSSQCVARAPSWSYFSGTRKKKPVTSLSQERGPFPEQTKKKESTSSSLAYPLTPSLTNLTYPDTKEWRGSIPCWERRWSRRKMGAA